MKTMDTKELLYELCRIPAISDREYLNSDRFSEIIGEVCDEVRVTPMGSVIGIRRCGIEGAKTIMLDGHADQIGGYVSGYEGSCLKFTGTFDPRFLPGKTLNICGSETIKGVVAVDPKADSYKKINDLIIETGLDGDVLKSKAPIGTQIVYESNMTELFGNHIAMPSIDDRSAIAAAILAVNKLRSDIPVDVIISASADEEIGGFGALTSAFDVCPDYAIACDVSFAKQIGFDDEFEEMDYQVGIARGAHMNRRVTDLLLKLADKAQIKYFIEVEASRTGTNTSEIRVAGSGVPCGLIGLPMRYMHQNVETIDLSVIENSAELMRLFIEAVGEGEL